MAMSALGQKQTYAVQKGMSALPPIATAKADNPRERTCAVQPAMSALGHKRTCAVHWLYSRTVLNRPVVLSYAEIEFRACFKFCREIMADHPVDC
jgi:hypothetical protein